MDHLLSLSSIILLQKEVNSEYNTIYYYVPYIITLLVLYFLNNLIFMIIKNNNQKNDNLNMSFDFYGKRDGIQVVHDELTPEQSSLRMKFLIARTLVQASTWLKAPYQYALYNRLHGFERYEISILYAVAQVTSLLLGPLFGSLNDVFGRKKFCVLYSFVLAFQICLRLTGVHSLAYTAEFFTGICQILIDTAFESWFNFEANLLFQNDEDGKRQKNSYLREVFAKQIGIDCFSSIAITGLSTYLYLKYSIMMPFYICVAVSILTGFYIMFTWNENNLEFAHTHKEEIGKDYEEQTMWQKIQFSMIRIKEDKPLLAVGIIESCFKISLVLFMFIWTPLLEETANAFIHPGSIFVCFMLARLIGSDFFDGIKKNLKTNTYILSIFITVTGTISFIVEYWSGSFSLTFFMLIYFDGLSGILFPLMSSLKSQMIPEKLRTTIMTFFRLPINVICILTLFISQYITTLQICLICFFIMLLSAIVNILLFVWHTPPDAEKRKIETTTHINKKRSSKNLSGIIKETKNEVYDSFDLKK